MEAEMVRVKNKTLVLVKKLGAGEVKLGVGAKGLEGMVGWFVFLEVSGFGLVTRNEEEQMGMELTGIFICVSVGIQCWFALQLDNHLGIVNSCLLL